MISRPEIFPASTKKECLVPKYRIGIIGHTGKGNYGHGIDTVWLRMPNTQIVGVADADAGGLEKAKARLKQKNGFRDYREMLDKTKPQIVSICPRWVDQHRDMVLACAERGIHVYMEKPMCRSLKEADEMVAACTRKKVKLAVAHQTRYSPRLQVIKDLIYDDKLGKILEIRGRGKEDGRGGGEDLWVLGSHIMNLMHYFAGEPEWCFASVNQGGKPISKDSVKPGKEGIGPLAGDALTATYGMQEGITAYFASYRGAAGNPRRFGIQILGSKGIVEVGTGYLPSVFFLPDSSWSPGRSGKKWLPVTSAGVGKPEPIQDKNHHGGNIAACKDLLQAIVENRQPECSIFEGRTTIEMIAAVFESQRVGKPVKMPLANRANPLTLL